MDSNSSVLCMTMIALTMWRNAFDIFWPYLVFILTYLFNVKLYKYKNTEKVNHICNNVTSDFAASYDENDTPTGLVLERRAGWPRYICYIESNYADTIIYVLSNEETRRRLVSAVELQVPLPPPPPPTDDAHITYYHRAGQYAYFSYQSRRLRIAQVPGVSQQCVLSSIVSAYQARPYLSCYVHGPTGTGKTMLCYLVCKHFNGSFCDTFNPSDPGDTFENVYSRVRPTPAKPLVVLLDEVDGIIDKVHAGRVHPHKKCPTPVNDKCTWSLFFDRIDRGLFPYVVIMLCSNRAKTTIDAMDPAYLRPGRMHAVHELVMKNE